MGENPIPAAQIIITVIPIVGIVTAGVVIFFYLLWRNKQLLLQIENKIYTPLKFNVHAFCLLAGILLVMVGTVLTVLFAVIDGVGYVLLGGLIPLSCGIGLLVFCFLSKEKKSKERADD